MLKTRTLLFDGACGFCKRTARLVKWLDWLGKIETQDFMSNWPPLQTRYPLLEMDACLRDMHVIRADGRVDRGFDGYRSLAWVVPALWPILPFMYIPPLHWLGSKVYRYVADHRRRECEIASRS